MSSLSQVDKVDNDLNNKNDSKKSNSNKKKKSRTLPKRQHDPDGSLSIARGNVTPSLLVERTAALLEHRTEAELKQIHTHYQGPHAVEAKERQEWMQLQDWKDTQQQKVIHDATTTKSTSKQQLLSEHEQRALQRRQKNSTKTNLQLHGRQVKRLEAAVAAADAQLLLNTHLPGTIQVEHDMERTARLTQVELKNLYLNQQTANHIYELQLSDVQAPYGLEYDRSGRASILWGTRGHVATMDQMTLSLGTEFHVNVAGQQQQERIRHACFLHNPTLMAVAQTNHLYIYDNTGAEVHKLKDHQDPMALTYLPHHWLLASIGRSGYLKYHDVSTGELISQHRTQQGSTNVMRHNPTNAMVHIGHKNGTVTLWSPASSTYLVKLKCHNGAPITSLAVQGHVMVTGGADSQVKLWDIRMFQPMFAYYCKGGGIPTSLDISQRGVLGIGHGCHATFWEDCATKHSEPYMTHCMPGKQVSTLRFRPFEDVCGIGQSHGISSIVIPGSGEPNLDTAEYHTNPFSDLAQTREAEVRSLLDKLSPYMIALDPDVVGTMEVDIVPLKRHRLLEQQKVHDNKNDADSDDDINNETKNKAKKAKPTKKRGRSKIQTQLRRKAKNVIDQGTIKLKEAREVEKNLTKQQQKQEQGGSSSATSNKNKLQTPPAALQRFFQ